MSRAQFEELVDDLSALLLTVDFGTPKSLSEAQARVGAVLDLLEKNQRHDLAEPAKKLLATLSAAAGKRQLNAQARTSLSDQLERLTQTWYDAAKTWREPDAVATGGAGRLQLSETADPALLAEFIANARLTGDDLETLIDKIRTGSSDATADLRRLIHTLKGESGMLGLDELARLLHATETYLETSATTWARADQLLRVRDWMLDALLAYEKGLLPEDPAQVLIEELTRIEPEPAAQQASRATSVEPQSPSTGESAAGNGSLQQPARGANGNPTDAEAKHPPKVVSIAASAPPQIAPVTWDEQDLDLVGEFLHESKEATGAIDQTLLEIEHDGPDAERVNKLFRAFHTLKGVASFLRLDQIVELTHTAETMLDMVRSGKLAAETGVIDLVFDATTLLRSLLAAVETAVTTSTPLAQVSGTRQLVQRIQATIRGERPQGSLLPAAAGSRIGEILVENCAISEVQLDHALKLQKETGRKLGEELIVEGSVQAKVVAQALRGQNNVAAQPGKTKELLKVDLERVDNLVETIGELVIVESMVSNAPEIHSLPVHLRNYLGQFAKITRELQELGMYMRMVPLRSEFQKMARMVRDLTRRSHKQVRIELRGEQTEMDRSMVEQIADPLVHLIRNAVDHGVEPPADRVAQGKPETATIILSATHEGGSIVIEISDDGRGINREAVLAKAISQGLVSDGAILSDSQVYDLLFMPGFSTAAQVTEISGRGVGMDVVKRNIEAIRGRIMTQSAKGRGTSFRLILPLTLAIIDGMVIRCGSERFIVPTLNIVESLQPTREMLFSIAGTHEHVLVRGQSLPLMRLGDLLEVDAPERDPTKSLIIIVESMHSKVALLVDEVVMKHQVVIKTLGNELGVNQFFAGAAILSNGRVGLILNVESLVETALTNRTERVTAVA
jgi:two-component system, chemotaxis family, sensor kinase CheA